MTGKKILIIAGTVLIFGGVGYSSFWGANRSSTAISSKPPKHRAPNLAPRIEQTRTDHAEVRMHALEEELSELKRMVAANSKAGTRNDGSPRSNNGDPAKAQAQLSPEQREELEQEAFDEIIQNASDEFEQDRSDEHAAETETKMREFLLSQNYRGIRIDSVECRSKQCQIVIHHQEPGTREQLDQAWSSDLFEGGTVIHYAQDLSQTMVYAVRSTSDS